MKTLSSLIIALVLCLPSGGQTIFQENLHNNFDFFSSEELLQMTLSFDIREFIRSKQKPKNIPAMLTVFLDSADSINQNIKVRARGEMRRNYCQFPPIMLKFKNDSGKSYNLKLVTHCIQTSLNEKYILKEFLTYKLFNLVTPYSFKTRLVQVRYIDINKPEKAFTSFGFLIENEERMAERTRTVVVDNPNLTQKHMNQHDMARIAVFNFLIGNTDWSVPTQHNIKILKSIDVISNKGIPVAYDFDYSGLVNTSYAIPNEVLPIQEVTERYYMGACYCEGELKPVLDEFAGLQDNLLKRIDEFEFLTEKDKKPVRNYIEQFFKTYQDQDLLLSEFDKSCKDF